MIETAIYTVSQLNQATRELLEYNFPLLWVEGEISNLRDPGSGHLYFTLKDANAQVRCALFRMSAARLPFKPKDGMHVLLQAHVSLYEGRGDFQLIVETMEETGDGKLRRAFEALKNKLAEEGLFAETHKKSWPKLPKAIGIVTSPTGAAVRDILSVLKRRFASIPVIIYPTQVQGAQAAGQIVHALQLVNQRQECDVIILARGGGSLEDLWPFNEEIVARAIYASHIPIITGIGHEIDFTIADFVSDHRAATPSAAAELVSPQAQEFLLVLTRIQERLLQSTQAFFRHAKILLQHLEKRLPHPSRRLQEQAQRLDDLQQRLCLAHKHYLQHQQSKLSNLMRALDGVSPLNTLKRGYAIVSRNGKTIDRCREVNIGDALTVKLVDGELECEVKNTLFSSETGVAK